MPTTYSGREKIKEYLEKNNVKITSLATMYNVSRPYMSNVLNGNETSERANKLILKIIADFNIK